MSHDCTGCPLCKPEQFKRVAPPSLNPYASIPAKETPTPDMDPSYEPFGNAPNAYDIAFALREIEKEK